MKALAALLALAAATPLAAQDRDLCTDRPGLGTPACTVSSGRVQLEVGLADWTRNDVGGTRSDAILFGDTLARIGVGERLELQIGWTPLGTSREASGGVVDRATRVGDVTLGAKLNLASPDGSGFSVALLPLVTLPAGRAPIGAGGGAMLISPISYDLSDTVQLQASPQIAAAVDADGQGRHLAWGGTVGLGLALTDALGLGLEAQAIRDRDPAGHATEAYFGLSLAWQRGRDLQLDAGLNLGLNRAADDREVYAGVTKRF